MRPYPNDFRLCTHPDPTAKDFRAKSALGVRVELIHCTRYIGYSNINSSIVCRDSCLPSPVEVHTVFGTKARRGFRQWRARGRRGGGLPKIMKSASGGGGQGGASNGGE